MSVQQIANPDLERARKAVEKWWLMVSSNGYSIKEAAIGLVLEQRAEEAERMIDVRSPYVPVASLRERGAELRRQAGEVER